MIYETKIDSPDSQQPVSMAADRRERIGDPAPLAMGGFAVTIITLSLAMMGFRGLSVDTENLFIGDLCFLSCFGLLISAQWAMYKGDTFSFTVLTAFSLFYGGYGAIMLPSFGIADSYGGKTSGYYNAMGIYIALWAVLNIFFVIATLPMNLVYISIFVCLQFCFSLDAAGLFAQADGNPSKYAALEKAAGAFAFVSGLLGFYTLAHYLCEDALPFRLPMGNTARFFAKRRVAETTIVKNDSEV